jgi:hypothetical protein
MRLQHAEHHKISVERPLLVIAAARQDQHASELVSEGQPSQ